MLATNALNHFELRLFGSVTLYAVVYATLCWVSLEIGLRSPEPTRRNASAFVPSAILAPYLVSWATGSLPWALPSAHAGGWSRRFSAKECLALYILLAVASIASVRVFRNRSAFFRVAGSVQLALSVAFIAREFSIIWQWYE